MGVSSATGPTPNKGFEAAGKQKIAVLLTQLEQLVPMLGATSEIGAAVLKAINLLAKHVEPGTATPAGQKSMAENMQMRAIQNQNQMQQLKQAGAGAQQQQPQGMAA
jgi:hypothetical protein